MRDTKEFNFDEISLYRICTDLVKNLWVILLAAAAMWFGIAGVSKLFYVPEYTAQATVAVGAKGNGADAYTSLNLTTQMAGVFSEVFQSDVLLEKIQEDLGEELDGKISSTVIEETNLMTLQATASNPRQAYLILQSALENYATVSDYLFSNAVLRMVQEPSVPFSPSNTFYVERIKKLGALGAALLAAAVIVVFSVLRFTVKTKASARRNLDGKILGKIPYEKKYHTLKESVRKKGKSILISHATVSMMFVETYRKLATHVENHMKRHEEKVVTITSVAENEGKSSVAANLALALAEKGRKVLLVDLDLKKPAQLLIFGAKETTKGILKEYMDGEKSVQEILNYDEKTHLYTIYQEKGVSNSGSWMHSQKVKELLKHYREEMDYIIIDSSPMGFSSDAELLMEMSDTAILVVRQDWSDIRAVNEAVDGITQSKTEFMGFVLNAFHKEIGEYEGSRYGYYGYGEKRKGGELNERA